METRPAPARIPDDEVASILARAAEIDRTAKETVSVDALRTAALEAGISQNAVDTALEEYAAGLVVEGPAVEEAERTPRFARPRAFLRRAWGPLKIGGVAFGLGLLGGAGEILPVLSVAAGLFITIRLILRYRESRRIRPFALRLVLLTLGLILGMAAVEVDEDVIAAVALGAVPVLFWGSVLVRFRISRVFGYFRRGNTEVSPA